MDVTRAAPDAGPGRSGKSSDARAALVGGGVASMAAAAFMIRDGNMPGHRTTIPEGLGTVGGSPGQPGWVRHARGRLHAAQGVPGAARRARMSGGP